MKVGEKYLLLSINLGFTLWYLEVSAAYLEGGRRILDHLEISRLEEVDAVPLCILRDRAPIDPGTRNLFRFTAHKPRKLRIIQNPPPIRTLKRTEVRDPSAQSAPSVRGLESASCPVRTGRS